MRDVMDIAGYHAHVYFDEHTREAADRLRAGLAARFGLEVVRLHEGPLGPHTRAGFQVNLQPEQFGLVVPWLMLNRSGLSLLVHPLTGAALADHLVNPLWLGDRVEIDDEFLRRLPSSEAR